MHICSVFLMAIATYYISAAVSEWLICFSARYDNSWQNFDVGENKLCSIVARMFLKLLLLSLTNHLPKTPPVHLWVESPPKSKERTESCEYGKLHGKGELRLQMIKTANQLCLWLGRLFWDIRWPNVITKSLDGKEEDRKIRTGEMASWEKLTELSLVLEIEKGSHEPRNTGSF